MHKKWEVQKSPSGIGECKWPFLTITEWGALGEAGAIWSSWLHKTQEEQLGWVKSRCLILSRPVRREGYSSSTQNLGNL